MTFAGPLAEFAPPTIRANRLASLGGQRSPLADRIAADLTHSAVHVAIEKVPYEFQRGGNEMMRIRQSPWRSRGTGDRENPAPMA